MKTFILLLWLAGYDAPLTVVEGYKSQELCQQAGNIWVSDKPALESGYRRFTCIPAPN